MLCGRDAKEQRVTQSPHQPCKGGVIIHRSVHTDPGHQIGRSALSSRSSRGGVGGTGCRGEGSQGEHCNPVFPSPLPKDGAPGRGVPLPLGEHTVILHPARNTPRKWAEMAGSRLRRRRQTAVLALGEVSAPQVSERADPAPLGAWREGDPNSKNCYHPKGHNWQPQATMPRSTLGRVRVHAGCPRARAGWVGTEPQALRLPEFWTREGAMGRQPGPVRQRGTV